MTKCQPKGAQFLHLAARVVACPLDGYATAHHGFITVREMKDTSQDFCDKSIDDTMALHCECCFPNCTQSW